MTREEAIKILEYPVKKWSMEWDEREDGLSYYEALDMAISALRQQEHFRDLTKKVEPLTLDELRKMSGEPVFAVTDRLKEWCLVHSHNSDDVIGGGIIMTRRTAEKRTYQYACYGKTWLAYRQKPEEARHEKV